MRAKSIFLAAAFGLMLVPLGVAAKEKGRDAPRRHEHPRADGNHRMHRSDEDRPRRGGLADEDRLRRRDRSEEDGAGHERRRRHEEHARRGSDHPHGGPPGHRMKRGRGHEKHGAYDADHPHGGPPGHRKHGDAGEYVEKDVTGQVLDAVLGD